MKACILDSTVFRQGHGGKLLEYIEKYAAANGIKKIYGDVYVNTVIGLDNLIRFYKKHGYTIYGSQTNLHFKKEIYIKSQ